MQSIQRGIMDSQSIVKITSSVEGKEEIKQTYKVSITLQILGKIVGEKMVLGLKASRKKISISDKASPEMKEYF